MPRPFRSFRLDLRAALLAGALAAACTPKIGDHCSTSVDCSATGDRLCDITQPGGYCTIFNCEPGSCPEDSACVNFGAEPSNVPGCATGQGSSPYQRAFCMATCGSDSDCRPEYQCTSLAAPNNQWSAVIVDPGIGAVCLARVRPGDPATADAGNAVCLGSDAGAPDGGGGEAGAAN